jgi:hypothetical protein
MRESDASQRTFLNKCIDVGHSARLRCGPPYSDANAPRFILLRPGDIIFAMQRILPHESQQLLEQLTAWIDWRYAGCRSRLVLTSAPTSVPAVLERWRPGAVWRLVWDADGSAALYGLAPGDGPTKYFVVRQDRSESRSEGLFQRQPDGTWSRIEGNSLALRLSRQQCAQNHAA